MQVESFFLFFSDGDLSLPLLSSVLFVGRLLVSGGESDSSLPSLGGGLFPLFLHVVGLCSFWIVCIMCC